MVEVVFHSRRRRIGKPLHDHALAKLSKVERLDPTVRRVDVEVSHEPFARHENERVELTVQTPHGLLRATGQSQDAWHALDEALRCLIAQVRRLGERRRVTERRAGQHRA